VSGRFRDENGIEKEVINHSSGTRRMTVGGIHLGEGAIWYLRTERGFPRNQIDSCKATGTLHAHLECGGSQSWAMPRQGEGSGHGDPLAVQSPPSPAQTPELIPVKAKSLDDGLNGSNFEILGSPVGKRSRLPGCRVHPLSVRPSLTPSWGTALCLVASHASKAPRYLVIPHEAAISCSVKIAPSRGSCRRWAGISRPWSS